MKILKRGVNPDNIPWRGTCSKCKTRIEIEQHEAWDIIDDQRDGKFGRYECPVCDNTINVYPVDPSNVTVNYTSSEDYYSK